MTSTTPPAASTRFRVTPVWLFSNVLEICAALMLIGICAIVFGGVIFRYFLHIGLGWTEELSRYLQIWMTFVGATVAVKRWSHFQLTIINQWIPESATRYTRTLAILLVMALAGVMIKNGTEITRVSWNQTSAIMGWNIGYLYLVVPVSGFLMEIFALRHLVDTWRGTPPPGADHSLPAAIPARAE